MIISSVIHELFRIMLLFPDLQGLGESLLMISLVFTLGHDFIWGAMEGCLGHAAHSSFCRQRAVETDSRKLTRAHAAGERRRGVGGAPTAPAPLIPRQLSSFISSGEWVGHRQPPPHWSPGNSLHSFPVHSSAAPFLEPPFLVQKIASSNTVCHLTFGPLSWRGSDKRIWKAS